jgi:hypothetical protein
MSGISVQDRCRGVLVGLAAGDRIGGPIRMAVRLAESLVARGAFNPSDILGRCPPRVGFLAFLTFCADMAASLVLGS